MITRGGTPSIIINCGCDVTKFSEIIFTLKQNDLVIERHITDMEIEDTRLIVTLTQEETVNLDDSIAEIQVKTKQGEVVEHSDIIRIRIDDELNEDII